MTKQILAFTIGLIIGATSTLSLFILHSPPREARTESVFVYGTLLNPYIRSVVCLCTTTPTEATLPDYRKVRRNIIPDNTHEVTGAVIRVSPLELRRLDRYERVPTKYQRREIIIEGDTHWVYVLN